MEDFSHEPVTRRTRAPNIFLLRTGHEPTRESPGSAVGPPQSKTLGFALPRRTTGNKTGTVMVLQNSSYESLVVSWLMRDGWQVFLPILDNAHQTDMLISDGPKYYRIQVKTVDAATEAVLVENRWKDSNLDCVVFFARNSNWGYVTPAFKELKKPLNSPDHKRFQQTQSQFLKAFHAL